MIRGRKREIKFISRKLAAEKLKLTQNEFNELCILTKTLPNVAKNSQKHDHADTLFYYIKDIREMMETDAYDIIKKRNTIERRRKEYVEKKRVERLKRLKEVDFNYQQLVKKRYNSFSDSVIGLSETLNILFLIKILFENEDASDFAQFFDEMKNVLVKFKEFITDKRALKNVFVLEKGMSYLANIQNIEIFWIEPFEKDENLDIKLFDLTMLKHIYKFCYFHLKLTMLKLKSIEIEVDENKIGVFADHKFYIENRNEHLEFIIRSGNGSITDSYNVCDYYITENNIKEFKIDNKYVQPQYLFDCYNVNELFDHKPYIVGQKLPEHKCPFEEDKTYDIDQSILPLLSKTKRCKIAEIIKERLEQMK